MKITISRGAAALDPETDDEITDPARLRKLHGIFYSSDKCSTYFSRELDEIGIVGGKIQLAFDAKTRKLRVVTEYHAPRLLTTDELKKLVDETTGQWSDGIGESEFSQASRLKMEVDLYPFSKEKPKAEQVEDGKKVKKPKANELLKALEDGNREEALKLIAAGADLNRKDKWGYPLLHSAINSNLFDVALAMVEAGADAKAKSKEGDSVLFSLACAQVKGKRAAEAALALANALKARGIPIDGGNREGITPLMMAANRENMPLIEFLIQHGADVNATDRSAGNKNTVIMYAQRVDVFEILLEHGADPAKRNAAGETSWEYMLINDHLRGYRKLAGFLQSRAKKK